VVREGYDLGYERGHAVIDGVPASTTIRFTHVFRREEGRWRLVHRHGDFVQG
jgi:ketosteroid isomerase-like protein